MLNTSDEIKSRLDIIEVIRQYVPLKPAGLNFLARCPFHNEKSASFTVSPTKQVWHCFGCGRGGDLFSFVMEIEKITFVEALRLLAPRAGIVLKQESGPEASLRNRILDILEQATDFYHRTFINDVNSRQARHYVAGRGLSEDVIRDWNIGYAPDSWDDLIIFLKQKGFTDKEIILSGLAIDRNEGGRCYNRFRGRIMFPIREVNGNVVGFTGRLLPEFEKRDLGQGKYVNSPQTAVYDKGKVLFGLDKAKQAIREGNLAIVVEGQMDCLTAHQFGFTNVVASSGTALTIEQAAILKRYANRVAFAFDMDPAGRQALDRGSEQAFAFELEALAVSLPAGKDPDECIRKDLDGWKNSLSSAEPVMQYYLKEVLAANDSETATGRRAIVQKFLPRVARIANIIEKDFWLKKLSQAVDVGEHFLHEAMAAANKSKVLDKISVIEKVAPKAEQVPRNREEILSEQLVALLVAFPDLIPAISPYVPSEQIMGQSSQLLYRQLVVYYNKNIAHIEDGAPVFEYGEFRTWLSKQGFTAGDIQELDRLAILIEKNFSDIKAEEANSAIKGIQNELRRSYLNRRMKAVAKLIGEMESQNSSVERDERLDTLLKEFNDLAEEVRQLSSSVE
ncbi:MAG: DNA primase [Candidatus Falkowbacteria bacterium]|nr:DNA primase [Candidatus Falkowbacteria bacterium]